jgi:PmbA protein
MLVDVPSLKKQIQLIAHNLGIQKYDIFGLGRQSFSASAKNKTPFALSASTHVLLILRIWNEKNQVGVARTANLTELGLQEAFGFAQAAAAFAGLEGVSDFSTLALNSSHVYGDFENLKKNIVNLEVLVQKVIDGEQKILKKNLFFKSVPYNKISQNIICRFYFNTQGTFHQEYKTSALCYFYPLAQKPRKQSRQAGHVLLSSHFKLLDVDRCVSLALAKTKKHLDYKKIKSGVYTAVFSPEAFLQLLNAFSNFINGQSVVDHKSLFNLKSLGQKVAFYDFSLWDAPTHHFNPVKTFFDEEGTPTRQVEIIKKGVLKTFLHSSYSAQVLNVQSTGHGVLDGKVGVAHHFLYVKAGSGKSRSLKKEKNIVYLESLSALHAGVNALQGSFSLPFSGYFSNFGRFRSIDAATVAGDFLSLLNQICYVHKKELMTPYGIAPEIWVEGLSFTCGRS